MEDVEEELPDCKADPVYSLDIKLNFLREFTEEMTKLKINTEAMELKNILPMIILIQKHYVFKCRVEVLARSWRV